MVRKDIWAFAMVFPSGSFQVLLFVALGFRIHPSMMGIDGTHWQRSGSTGLWGPVRHIWWTTIDGSTHARTLRTTQRARGSSSVCGCRWRTLIPSLDGAEDSSEWCCWCCQLPKMAVEFDSIHVYPCLFSVTRAAIDQDLHCAERLCFSEPRSDAQLLLRWRSIVGRSMSGVW